MSSSLSSLHTGGQDERSGQAAGKKDNEYTVVAMYLLWTNSYHRKYMIQQRDNCAMKKCDLQYFSVGIHTHRPAPSAHVGVALCGK
jgi:hypothetical protein